LKGTGTGDDLVFEAPQVGDLVQRALNSTMPYVKAELSTINSLYELKDFAELYRLTKTVVSRVPALLKNNAETIRLMRLAQKAVHNRLLILRGKSYRTVSGAIRKIPKRDLLWELAGWSSGAFLQWKFAIAPLLSDIAAIKKVATSFQKRVNKLLSEAEKVRKVHVTTNFDEYTPIQHVESGLYTFGPSTTVPIAVTSSSIVDAYTAPSQFHWEAEYSYSYFRFQAEYAQLLAFMDALGVNMNAMQILWNAAPWTFVIDWLIGISSFLGKFKSRNLDPVVVIHRCCYSTKRSRFSLGSRKILSPGGLGNSYTSMPVVYETAYRRSVKMPDISSITSSGLSSSEVVLGTALAISQLRNRRNILRSKGRGGNR
jgi:hypothetical protein